MRRREFITLVGGAVVWPRSGVAQQSSIPIIGFLTARSRNETTDSVADFREGLREAGYRDGETVSIRFAKPFQRLGVVLPHAFAFRIHSAEGCLGVGIALLSQGADHLVCAVT
jgi:putative tryptophan/tyrosine transport system substrate-binding protein